MIYAHSNADRTVKRVGVACPIDEHGSEETCPILPGMAGWRGENFLFI